MKTLLLLLIFSSIGMQNYITTSSPRGSQAQLPPPMLANYSNDQLADPNALAARNTTVVFCSNWTFSNWTICNDCKLLVPNADQQNNPWNKLTNTGKWTVISSLIALTITGSVAGTQAF